MMFLLMPQAGWVNSDHQQYDHWDGAVGTFLCEWDATWLGRSETLWDIRHPFWRERLGSDQFVDRYCPQPPS